MVNWKIDKEEKYNIWLKGIQNNSHKKYEISCICSIFERMQTELKDGFWAVKPVFQKYVQRPDGSRALIDLCLDNLRLCIEVDEGQHAHQIEADKERENDVIDQLMEAQRGLYQFVRICCYKGYDKIREDINAAVEIIKRAYIGLKEKDFWNVDPGYVRYSVGDHVKFGDEFYTMSDVVNTLLHKPIWGKKSIVEEKYKPFGIKLEKSCFQTVPNNILEEKYKNQIFEIRRQFTPNASRLEKKGEIWVNEYDFKNDILYMYTSIDYDDNDKIKEAGDGRIHHFFSNPRGNGGINKIAYIGSWNFIKTEKVSKIYNFRNKNIELKKRLVFKKVSDTFEVK